MRIYLVNVTEFDLINSLHLHAMFFDVFRTGTSLTPSRAHRHADARARASGRSSRRRSGIRATSCSTRTRASSPSSGGWGCSARRRRAMTPERASRTLNAAVAMPGASKWLLALIAAAAARRPARRHRLVRPDRCGARRRLSAGRAPDVPARRRSSPAPSSPRCSTTVPTRSPSRRCEVDDAFWTFTTDERHSRCGISDGRRCGFRIRGCRAKRTSCAC